MGGNEKLAFRLPAHGDHDVKDDVDDDLRLDSQRLGVVGYLYGIQTAMPALDLADERPLKAERLE